MNFKIIGCGNVGSYLAHNIVLCSLEEKLKVDKLQLIDPDLLQEHNFPYGIDSSMEKFKKYIGYPKVLLLHDQLYDFNKNIVIEIINKKYPEEIKIEKNDFVIDCRDNNAQCSSSNLKINCDGEYGKIIIFPKDKTGENKNYLLFRSRFSANFLSCFSIEIIKGIIDGKYNNEKEEVIIYQF